MKHLFSSDWLHFGLFVLVDVFDVCAPPAHQPLPADPKVHRRLFLTDKVGSCATQRMFPLH